MSQYRTGTVSVVNGSATVAGSGVDWSAITTDHVFYVDGDSRLYELLAVPSATTLTLAAPYQGEDDALATYAIAVDFTPNYELPIIYSGDIGTRPLLRLLAERADLISAGVGGVAGVTSFKSRTGNVNPSTGDYTADQISETAGAKIMTAAERTKLGTVADGAQVNRLVASQAEAELGSSSGVDMVPVRTRQAMNAWLAGAISTSTSPLTLDTTADPAVSHFRKLVRMDNSAADKTIILPDATAASAPSGLFCVISATSGAHNVLVQVAVSGQLRSQAGVPGWNTGTLDAVYVGLSTAATDEAVIEVYRVGNLWLIKGQIRELVGDDLTTSAGGGAGEMSNVDFADVPDVQADYLGDGTEALSVSLAKLDQRGADGGTITLTAIDLSGRPKSYDAVTLGAATELALNPTPTPVGMQVHTVLIDTAGFALTVDGTTVEWVGGQVPTPWSGEFRQLYIYYDPAEGHAWAAVQGTGSSVAALVPAAATLSSGIVTMNANLGDEFEVTINGAWDNASPIAVTNPPASGHLRYLRLVATLSGIQTGDLSTLHWVNWPPSISFASGAVIELSIVMRGSAIQSVAGGNVL